MKKFGFTLAEIMIVVGLLGVVAALTIPNLSYNKMKREYAVKIKHFYSQVDNAVAQMELEKGSFRDMKLPANNRAAYEWYMANVDPFIGHKYIKNPDADQPFIYLKDGARIQLYKGGCVDLSYDVNGDAGNGKVGREYFVFLFCFSNDNREYWFGDKNTFWGVYGSGIQGKDITRQDMINKCNTEPAWCSKLLQYDDWEFKSDYPKFH